MSRNARIAKLTVGACAVTVALLVSAATAMAATVTVNTTTDEYDTSPNASCSLREAIKSVDGSLASDPQGTDFGGCHASGTYSSSPSSPDTIMLPAGTYQLTQAGAGEDNDATGDLDVLRSMDILGTGNPTIQQTIAERVIDLPATGKNLSLSGLTITGGNEGGTGAGGGINYVGADTSSLSLDGVTITGNNTAAGNGAGIWTDSPTTITNSVISNNKAAQTSGNGNGGGIYQDGFAGSFAGVTLSVDNSSITGNSAGDATHTGEGGGIYRKTKLGDATSSAVVQGSEVSGNTAHNSGGGINSTSDATLQVLGSLISGNHALTQRGGGLIAVSEQSSGSGQVEVVNSTVTGNNANQDGGGIQGGAEGLPVSLKLLFSTIGVNSSSPGSELNFSGNSSPKPTLTIEGTIFAASNPSAMSACHLDGTDFASVSDGGYNISTDPTDTRSNNTAGPGCGLSSPLQPGDRTGVLTPVLNALADNGGPTKTMQPTASSFAVDNMPNSVCTAITPAATADQRGFPRPETNGANCDSGAFENQPPTIGGIADASVQVGQTLQMTATGSDPDTGDALVFTAPLLPSGATFNPATRLFSWMPDSTQVGSHTALFQVSDGFHQATAQATIDVTAASSGQGQPGAGAVPPKKKCKKKKKHRAAAAKKKCKKRK